MDNRLWICGQYRSGEFGNAIWDFQGVFSTKGKAITACRNYNYFIFPVAVDEELPDETIIPPEYEYPIGR